MPITYAQPEPLVPGISAAYGAANQWSQDAPTIAGVAEHAAALQQQGNARADQLRFAYAQANAQAQNEQADRYFKSTVLNANREQGAQDLGEQLTQQGDLAMLHANTGLIQQQRGAELQNWLNDQDLSQKETMRLQQMKGAISDVQSSNLPDDEKQNMLMKLKTGIDPLDQRMKAQQARTLKSTADLHDVQTKLETQKVAEMAKVNEMTADQRVFQQLTPEAQMEIDSQNLTPMERDAAVKAAKAAGKFETFTIGPTGELKHIPKTLDKHDEYEFKRYETEQKAYLDQKKHWDDKVNRLEETIRGHLQAGDKTAVPAYDDIQREVQKRLATWASNGEVPPTAPSPIGGRRGQTTPTPQATPAPQATGASDLVGANPVGTPLKEQAQQHSTEILKRAGFDLENAPIPPEMKMQASVIVEEANRMIEEAKGYKNMSPEQKKRYDGLVAAATSLGKFQAVPPPQDSTGNLMGAMFRHGLRPSQPSAADERDERRQNTGRLNRLP